MGTIHSLSSFTEPPVAEWSLGRRFALSTKPASEARPRRHLSFLSRVFRSRFYSILVFFGFWISCFGPSLAQSDSVLSAIRVAVPSTESSLGQRVADVIGLRPRDASDDNPPDYIFVDHDSDADIFLQISGDRVWFLFDHTASAPLELNKWASVQIGLSSNNILPELDKILSRLATGRHLLRNASDLVSGEGQQLLSITAHVVRDPKNQSSDALANWTDERECMTPALRVPGSAESVPPADNLMLLHCDALYLAMENNDVLPVDVTLLFMDAKGELYRTRQSNFRISPHGIMPLEPIQVATRNWMTGEISTVGVERLFIVSVEQRVESSQIIDFGVLAAPTLSRGPDPKRGRNFQQKLVWAKDQKATTRSPGQPPTADGSLDVDPIDLIHIGVLEWETAVIE